MNNTNIYRGSHLGVMETEMEDEFIGLLYKAIEMSREGAESLDKLLLEIICAGDGVTAFSSLTVN